jgi:hypothetical protein
MTINDHDIIELFLRIVSPHAIPVCPSSEDTGVKIRRKSPDGGLLLPEAIEFPQPRPDALGQGSAQATINNG